MSVALRVENTHANSDIGEVMRLEELERSLDGPPRAKHRHGHIVLRMTGNSKAQAQATALRLFDELCKGGGRQQRRCLCERVRVHVRKARSGRPASMGEARFVAEGLGAVRWRFERGDCIAREGDGVHRRGGGGGKRGFFQKEGKRNLSRKQGRPLLRPFFFALKPGRSSTIQYSTCGLY
jgi:hypothetical protein